jgi:hypothetical protein
MFGGKAHAGRQPAGLTFLGCHGRLYLLYSPLVKKLFYILSFKLTGMPDLTGKPLYARRRMYFFSNFKDFNTLAPAQ